MGFTERYAEFVFRTATTKNKLRIISTPLGVVFWFGLSTLFVFAALGVDMLLPIQLPLPTPVNIYVALPLLIIGGVSSLWTFITFIIARGTPVPLNPPKKLVVKGLYAYIRNPMVVGWVILLFGIGVILKSISLIVIFTPIFIWLNVLYLKNIEEKEMEKKFGKDYLKYKESVPRFFPKLGRRR